MNAAVDDTLLAVAALLWAVVAHRTMALGRRPHDAAQRALWLTFVGLAAAITLFLPWVHVGLGRLTGLANIAEPLARTCVLLAAWSAQALIIVLADPPQAAVAIRRRAVTVGWTIAVMWALFAAAPVQAPTLRMTSAYGASPLIVLYFAVFLTYLGFALADVLAGCLRYARAATTELRLGLRINAAGNAVGLAYVGTKAVAVTSIAAGVPVDPAVESTAARSLAGLAGVLVTIGSSLPALRSRTCGLRRWWRSYRARRRLYPLWLALFQAVPQIGLDPPASRWRDALRLRRAEFLLYRRVIEIRDGQLALRGHIDGAVAAAATRDAARHGLAASEAAVAGEAAALAAALRARADGTPPATAPMKETSTGEADLEGEVRLLLLLARHFVAPRQRLQAAHTGAGCSAEATHT